MTSNYLTEEDTFRDMTEKELEELDRLIKEDYSNTARYKIVTCRRCGYSIDKFKTETCGRYAYYRCIACNNIFPRDE